MNPKGKNWQGNPNLCPTDLDVAVKVFLKTVLKLLEQIFFPLVSAASTAAEFASCLASCVHSAASCFDFSSWTMQTAVLHAQLVICSVSSHFVMSICSQPEETSINSQRKKRKTLSNCRNLQRRKSFFYASRSRAHLASRRRQTSAVSVPSIFIESATRVWWWGRVGMDRRGRIDETEENYRSLKTRFIKANGNLGSKYIFPAFTHDSTVVMWHF